MSVKRAVKILGEAERILVFTGAGISTESGIPDFRGPDGLWKRVDPADFSLGAFVGNPAARRRSWQMMRNERLIGDSVEPNAAHHAIVALWEAGRLAGCVTQNVDGLHQAAGLPADRVAELHGNAATVTCWECRTVVPFAAVRQRLEDGDPDPACDECGGVLKPSMVMFGEMLPPEPMKRAAVWAHDVRRRPGDRQHPVDLPGCLGGRQDRPPGQAPGDRQPGRNRPRRPGGRQAGRAGRECGLGDGASDRWGGATMIRRILAIVLLLLLPLGGMIDIPEHDVGR